jgi:NADPH-ferrihemoprotein reductase
LVQSVQGTPYAVFGLGNKTYEHFNAMGKYVHKHLARLGGTPLVPVGLGDDDADIADEFDNWSVELFKAIDAKALLHQSSTARTGSVQTKRGYMVTTHPAGHLTNGALSGVPDAWVGAAEKHVPVMMEVRHVRELHSAKAERSCVHAEVSLAGAHVNATHKF